MILAGVKRGYSAGVARTLEYRAARSVGAPAGCVFGKNTGHVLSGTVCNAGTPVSGAAIHVFMEGGGYRAGTTRSDGTFKIIDLPSGSYGVSVYDFDVQGDEVFRQQVIEGDCEIHIDVADQALGYLPQVSDGVPVEAEGTGDVTVALEPAATLRFVLPDRIKRLLNSSHLSIRCKLTDNVSGKLVVVVAVLGQTQLEHEVIIPTDGVSMSVSSTLALPAGSYRLDYRLLPYYQKAQKHDPCCYQGSTVVEPVTGQVTTVVSIGD